MALILRGNELIATTALSAKVLSRLVGMAARRPLIINGVELRAQDLERLAEESRRNAQPIWLGSHPNDTYTTQHAKKKVRRQVPPLRSFLRALLLLTTTNSRHQLAALRRDTPADGRAPRRTKTV